MPDRYITKQTFSFLSSLAENNSRDWFKEHQQDYEDFVRTPALDFITDMSNEMPSFSRHFLAQPKKVGGSLMRIHRDIRFGNDKTPYKNNELSDISWRFNSVFPASLLGCTGSLDK